MYKPRLEAADLWDLAEDEGDDEQGAATKKATKWMRNPLEKAKEEVAGDEPPEQIKKAFAKEKVSQSLLSLLTT